MERSVADVSGLDLGKVVRPERFELPTLWFEAGHYELTLCVISRHDSAYDGIRLRRISKLVEENFVVLYVCCTNRLKIPFRL